MEITITALLSFAIGVLSWSLKEWWMAPRLQVQGDVQLRGEGMIGHTLRLSNVGKRASALNCLGIITIENLNPKDIISSSYSELEKYTDAVHGKEEPPESKIKAHLSSTTFREIKNEKLCWADIGNPQKININPLTDAGLDIYRVDRQTKNLYFPSEAGWGSLRAVLKPKKYKGVITISPENAKPLKVKFKLIPEEDDVIIKCQ